MKRQCFTEKQGYQIFAEMENWYSDGSSMFGLRKNLKLVQSKAGS